MESTTIKTTLEYAVMDMQSYEFVCRGCYIVKSINDYVYQVGVTELGTAQHLCTECI
jgi:hypothetical protein